MPLGPMIDMTAPDPLSDILRSFGGGLAKGIGARYDQQQNRQATANINWDDPNSVLQAMMRSSPNVAEQIKEIHARRTDLKKSEKPREEKKSPLTLNESIARLQDRLKLRNESILRPFVKQDALGNLIPDFEGDEKKKAAVLQALKANQDEYEGQLSRLYRYYGMPVPEDILARTSEKAPNTNVSSSNDKQNDEIVGYLNSKYPPEQFKGKQKKNDKTGMVYQSDGKTWIQIK